MVDMNILTVRFLQRTEQFLIKSVQFQPFPNRIKEVQQRLPSLSLFLHADGPIRLGGRLRRSSLAFDKYQTSHFAGRTIRNDKGNISLRVSASIACRTAAAVYIGQPSASRGRQSSHMSMEATASSKGVSRLRRRQM
ncbi:hypothetical protein ILUMI_09693 [Ignelater luminosus]|uniref:Uncharacterized protein n=1 Tax=Ignelater luminosus TaxID=2038154 RepID=A0A8K0D3R1_IGNLU|nr:hypothetical protein ILUMI_09693 [Ignelater luminosus]